MRCILKIAVGHCAWYGILGNMLISFLLFFEALFDLFEADNIHCSILCKLQETRSNIKI
jgi:hypothetical protein